MSLVPSHSSWRNALNWASRTAATWWLPARLWAGMPGSPSLLGLVGTVSPILSITWSTMEVKEKAVRGCKAAREAPTMLLTWELRIAGWSTTFWIHSKWFPNRSRNASEINLVSPTDPASSRHLSKKSFMFTVARSELVSLLKEQLCSLIIQYGSCPTTSCGRWLKATSIFWNKVSQDSLTSVR